MDCRNQSLSFVFRAEEWIRARARFWEEEETAFADALTIRRSKANLAERV
jgi:hypothetical protein